MSLVQDFAEAVNKIAKEMRLEGSKPGMPTYVLTSAIRLENLAAGFIETEWEISMGDDL